MCCASKYFKRTYLIIFNFDDVVIWWILWYFADEFSILGILDDNIDELIDKIRFSLLLFFFLLKLLILLFLICLCLIFLIEVCFLFEWDHSKVFLNICAETEVDFHFQILKIFHLVVIFILVENEVYFFEEVTKNNVLSVFFGD